MPLFSTPRSKASTYIIPVQGFGAANKLQGVYPFDTGYNNNISAYEAWLGSSVNNVIAFSNGPDWTTLVANTNSQISSISPNNKRIIWALCLPPGATLVNVTAGAYDVYLLQLANAYLAARPSDSTIIIEVFKEFQINTNVWTSYGIEENYKAAFRYITQFFLRQSLKFRFCWCPNWTTTNSGDTAPYDPTIAYPGDTYVDIIGMDFYYISSFDGADSINAFRYKMASPFGLNWLRSFAKIHNKPIAFPEFGIDTDTAASYISSVNELIQAENVAYYNYFNFNNGALFMNQLDLGVYPTAGARFIAEFASPTKTNLLTFGKDFTNAIWSDLNQTVVGGQADADGSNNAQSLFETTTNGQHLNNQLITKDAAPHIYRVFIRAKPINTRIEVRIQSFQNAFVDGETVYCDISAANSGSFFAFGAMGTPIPLAYPDLNGFAKIGGEFLSSSATDLYSYFGSATADGTDSYVGDVTKGTTVYDAWLRVLPTNLLVSPANYTVTATWVEAGAATTRTAAATAAPNTAVTWQSLVDNATTVGVNWGAKQTITILASTGYQIDVEAKQKDAAQYRYLQINFLTGSTNRQGFFDLQTGVAVGTPTGGVTQSITPLANGGYRCRINATSGVAETSGVLSIIWGGDPVGTGNSLHTGIVGSGIYLGISSVIQV